MKIIIATFLLGMLGMAAACQTTPAKNSLLRHVVIFKFKDSSTPAQVEGVAAAFKGLYGQVPQIKGFEWGINNSPEHFNEGFTHCFILTFASEKDLADYQLDPHHIAFQKILRPQMEKVFVVDYWTRE
jgi:hypothetical protein